jgi:hypothetical protein
LGLRQSLALAAQIGGGGLVAPRPSHFEPKARHLVIIYLNGGMSHTDTFDYKPELQKNHGKKVAAEELFYKFDGTLLASPFSFAPAGETGLMVSVAFPYLSTVMDEICVINSLHTDILEHSEATLAMHTGSPQFPMPGLGAWVSYGLGTLNADLPSYIVVAKSPPYGGTKAWDNVFLPPEHQGVPIIPGDDPIPNLKSVARSIRLQDLEQIMLRDINQDHAKLRPGDFDLRGRISSFDMARGMMRTAPALFDISDESESTIKMYGLEPGEKDKTSFGYQCIVARRMIEQGVRVVELVHGGWDAHGDVNDHRNSAKFIDQATAALIRDLRQRGLLDETLIAICTEFGRTPWYQDHTTTPGRNHWHKAFTCLLAGAGVRGGMAYGKTNEFGSQVAEDPCHVHDFHATILHLLGLDHTQLTYRYGGRDFRLTDVSGEVAHAILS